MKRRRIAVAIALIAAVGCDSDTTGPVLNRTGKRPQCQRVPITWTNHNTGQVVTDSVDVCITVESH